MVREILKMLMSQTCLKILDLCPGFLQYIPFMTYPGALCCFKNLSVLNCDHVIDPKFFRQLSRTCHHLQSLELTIEGAVSNGLIRFIAVQQNLTHLKLLNDSHFEDFKAIIPALTKVSNTLIKLDLNMRRFHAPLSFVGGFVNLQELVLSIGNHDVYFKHLRRNIFPRLRVFKLNRLCPDDKNLFKFLKNNGKNLEN